MLCAFNFNSKIRSTVQPPVTATQLSTTATFFGGQSIHRLLFKPLYNFHFLSLPKVAVVKRFNCTVVNAKNKPSKLLVGLQPTRSMTQLDFVVTDRSLRFCNLEKVKWSSKCLSFHRQPKRTMCGFGLQRSFGRNILELLVYYLMLNKRKHLKDMKSCFTNMFLLIYIFEEKIAHLSY